MLPPRGWVALLEIAATALWVEIGLRLLPFRRVTRIMLRALPRRTPPPQARLDEVTRLASAVFRRAPVTLTCLKQTLILGALLARRGVPVNLKIGVAKTADTLQAHAWLEQDGLIVADQPDVAQRFQAVLSCETSEVSRAFHLGGGEGR
ncbi:MAG: lasso peptide biosynthesis B2 protein [Candidatus Omnitrophica bacterium]|nr:lasso peptide biosynthesis B2 protein [Candidatus Omnitrophota bacterium]